MKTDVWVTTQTQSFKYVNYFNYGVNVIKSKKSTMFWNVFFEEYGIYTHTHTFS